MLRKLEKESTGRQEGHNKTDCTWVQALDCEDVFKHAEAGDKYASDLVQETARCPDMPWPVSDFADLFLGVASDC